MNHGFSLDWIMGALATLAHASRRIDVNQSNNPAD